jgi:hypothetical protein
MLIEIFVRNLWACIGLWVLLAVSDYLLTLKGAKMYQQGVKKHFIFSHGYELEPAHQEAIANLRPPGFAFILQLILFGGLLAIAYYTATRDFFTFFWGSLILLQIAVLSRQYRNLLLFRFASRSQGIKGQIEYEHWFSLRLSSQDFFSFGLILLFAYLFTGSFFLLGGAASCLVTAARHRQLSIKAASAHQVES